VTYLLSLLVTVASGLRSTTYGWGTGDLHCGDIGHAVECVKGLPTASGEPLDPNVPQIAIAAPTWLRLKSVVIPIRLDGKRCVYVRLVDKMNPRYIGFRGFDLTPASVKLVGGVSTRHWSGTITVCNQLRYRTKWEVIQWNLK